MLIYKSLLNDPVTCLIFIQEVLQKIIESFQKLIDIGQKIEPKLNWQR